MSSGFPTKLDSNQPAELQRLARKLNDVARSKFTCATFQLVNNTGADQPVSKCRLDCALYVRKPRRRFFSRRGRLQTELKYPSKNRRRFTQRYNMTKMIFS